MTDDQLQKPCQRPLARLGVSCTVMATWHLSDGRCMAGHPTRATLCWLLGTSVLRKEWILRTDVPRSQHSLRPSASDMFPVCCKLSARRFLVLCLLAGNAAAQ